MKAKLLFLAVAVLLVATVSQAQNYSRLDSLANSAVNVYYSPGNAPRATQIAQRVNNAMAYYQGLLGFRPEVTLLVLSPADWSQYTTMPVYGMPHYKNDKVLVLAAEDNAFWKSFVPPLDQLPKDLSAQIRQTYKNEKGELSMQPFFDLLALHELGHAFHMQAGVNLQRKWLSELYANILLHTYIAENEPTQLPALTLFPKMVVSQGASQFTYTSLADAHHRYAELGQKHPKNYGWYQCRWHMAAGKIYDASGPQACSQLWQAFIARKENLPDAELLTQLEKANKAVANFVVNWDRESGK